MQDHEVSPALQVGIQIQEKIAHAQIELIRGELEAGGTAQFGCISATVEGLSCEKRFVPWAQVSEIEGRLLSGWGHRVYIGVDTASKTADGKPTRGIVYIKVPASEVYNQPTLELLCDLMHYP